MVTIQSVQDHTGLIHPFSIFLTFGHSGAQDSAPVCPNVKKIKNGGLDQNDAECFGSLIFTAIRKSVEPKGLTYNKHILFAWSPSKQNMFIIC